MTSDVAAKGAVRGMCLETHFQYEFSIFWAVGAAEKKKISTAISMQLFGVVFVGKRNF